MVGEYVTLNRKGRKLWACCPFHNEKTPSFNVDPETGLFYCFGCHKGGNSITFLSEYEHIEKIEAIKLLAERAHMELPERSARPAQSAYENDLKDRIYEANRFAARFYHARIWQSEGASALKYLYERGLNDSDIKRFGLGAAPAHGSELHDALVKEGFSEDVIRKAWLSGENEGRVYDMFRERVMFPIINPRGHVLGFGGRVMGKGEPKYLNTSDTPVFSKRNGLYGLNFSLGKDVPRPNRLILVEGYMDTVMLLKHGISGVIATLGTALTEEQVRLIKRYARELWISYDGDAAGQKAALRALDITDGAGLDVRVIDYPSGMDPDEFLKARGREEWEKLPRHKPAKYRMLRAEDGLELSTQEGMTEYTVRCCRILKTLDNAVELENYLRELSARTGYTRDVLMRQIGQVSVQPQPERRIARPRDIAKPANESENAQKLLIALLAAGLIGPDIVKSEDFDNELYAEICTNLSAGEKPGAFIDSLPEEQTAQALEAISYTPLPETPDAARKLAEELLATVRRQRLNSRISILTERLSTAREDEKEEITQRLNELLMKL